MNAVFWLLLITSLAAIGIADPSSINEANPSILDNLSANYSLHNESPIEIFANESDNSSNSTNVTIVALESVYDFPEEVTANYSSDLRSYDEDVASIQANGDISQIGNQYVQALGMGSATNNMKISINDE